MRQVQDRVPSSHLEHDVGAAGMLKERLGNVCWLGGGSGAGKSTVARALAGRFGLRLYATDEVMADHTGRCGAQDSPRLEAFKAMDMDERWVNRSPQAMLESFHWFAGEGFDLIVKDLLRIPPGERVLAEGFRLLPRLIRPLLARPNQAVWLIPTPAFRETAFAGRADIAGITSKTRDPDRALANLLQRDQLFTAQVDREAQDLTLATIRVDGALPEADLVDRVAAQLALS